VDAKKERYGADEALGLLTGMTKLLVAKGKKVTEVDLKKDRPDDDTLAALMLGPTGNLRAPTMKVGKIMLVGFNPESYDETLT
jgi:arsenate reductase-like glutaredoxin family protein